MNALSIPGAAVWLDTLLILSVQATLLAGIVWLVVKLLGRWIPPSWRALLWFVVIARVLIPIAPPSPFSLQNFFVKPIAAKPAAPAPPRTEIPENSHEINLQTRGVINSTVFRPPPTVQPKAIHHEINPAKTLAMIWAMGAILFLGLLITRSLIIRGRLVRHGCAADSTTLGAIEECRVQLRLRIPIRVTVSDRIAAPALTGLIPARLILPTNFCAGQFTSAQVRQILLHELSHIKQGHLLLHWLALVARALHWFNPAIHFAAAGLRQECELAADAAALRNSSSQERAAYGETILQVLSHSTAPPTLLAMGMADRARHLEQRLRALSRPTRRRYHLAGIVALGAACLAGLSGAQTETTNSADLTANGSAVPNGAVSVNTIPALVATNKPRLTSESQTTNRVPVLGDIPIIDGLFQNERATNFSKTAAAPGQLDGSQDERTSPAIRDARTLIEVGRYDEAEGLLKQAVKENPRSRAALDYLDLIKERRYVVAQANDEKSSVDEFAQSKARLLQRDKILRKIDTIRINDFPLTTPVDLLEVVKELNFEARKLDPEHEGVNFILDKARGRAADLKVDLDRFKIKIDPPVRNVTLGQLCEVIVRVAAPPAGAGESVTLEYAVRDYGIVFSVRPRAADQYINRTFKVNPNDFEKALDAILARISGTQLHDIPTQVRAFFEAAGVDFGATNRAIFYNDRNGVLFARATPHELDLVENALHSLNTTPPQVNFAVEVFDLPHDEGIRFQKELENQSPTMATNEFLFVYPDRNAGVDPVLRLSKTLVEKIPDPVTIASVIVPGVQAIVPRSKARSLRKTLQSAKGVDAVTMPNVTTIVQRQARISIEEFRTVVTTITIKSGSAVPAVLGWSFDCFPMAFDGRTLEMECSAGDTEFLGYDKVGEMPAPTFQVRGMGLRTKIAPGDSQVLFMPAEKAKTAPVIGDIPNLERLVNAQNENGRFVLILITPTIVDAAGNIVFPKSE